MAGPFDDLVPNAAPGGLAPRGTFIPKPADPYKAKADARADVASTLDVERLRLAREEAARQAAKDAREAAKEKPPIDPALKQKLDDLQLNDVLYAVQRARDIIHNGHATGIVGQLGKTFWGSSANDLQGAINTIGGNTLLNRLQALKEASATGASGLGQLSNREGEYLRDSIASIKPEMSAQAILDGLAQVERHTKALQAIQQGQNPDDKQVQKQFGIMVAPPPASPPSGGPPPGGLAPRGGNEPDDPNGGLGLTKGIAKTQTVPDPALAGVNSHVKSLIRAGRGKEVPAYLESVQPGLSRNPGVAPNLPQWIQFVDQHPGYKGPIGVSLELKQLPVSPVQGELNRLATETAGGAGLVGGADALSMGTIDNMTGNPALTRAGMSSVQAQHPGAFLAGQVGGQAALGALGELGLARFMGPSASALTSDVLSGIGYGAGSADEGSRGAGAVTGGLAGLVGNRAGAGLSRVVGGAGNMAAERLSALDVPMTVPQILGGKAKSLEDRLTGFWGVGDLVKSQRRKGIEGFNSSTLQQALEPIGVAHSGQIGEAGVNDALDAYSKFTNDLLSPVRVSLDDPYQSEIGHVASKVAAVPDVGPTLFRAMDGTIAPLIRRNGGGLSGLDMQAIDRGLNDISASYKDHPLFSTDIRPAIEDARSAVEGMFQRQAPEVMPGYQSSKETYKRISTVADAVNAAVNQNGVFLPSQLGTAARNSTKKFGGRNAAATGERPFFQLQRDAQNTLPSQIPDSGTAGRLALPGALALAGAGGGGAVGYHEDGDAGGTAKGAGAGTLLGLGTAAALTSPYLARPILQKVLTAPRSNVELLLGDYIRRARVPGSLAIPLLAGGQIDQ